MAYGTNSRTEGGQGGRRGHSNMSHWDTTDNVKTAARKARRHQDRKTTRAWGNEY